MPFRRFAVVDLELKTNATRAFHLLHLHDISRGDTTFGRVSVRDADRFHFVSKANWTVHWCAGVVGRVLAVDGVRTSG